MRWWLTLVIVLGLAGIAEAQPALRPTAVISSQTTTTIVSAVAGKHVQIQNGSLCVDANGVITGVALQSTGGTNILGTGMVYVLPPGACLYFAPKPQPGFYGSPTAAGTGLQVVTSVGNGPVKVYLEVTQQ